MKKIVKKLCMLLLTLAALAGLTVLIIWIVWTNKTLEVSTYTISSDRLPESFSGFRIAQVSDLHNTQMGDDNERLLALLREAEPDIIVITGDLISVYRVDLDVALGFAERAMEIAPCYFVPGNHEGNTLEYEKLREGLKAAGVVVLENKRVQLERNGESVSLLGLSDPCFYMNYPEVDSAAVMSVILDRLKTEEVYTILLSHRPELFDVYAAHGIDLVFSGHAHGGQFRLPYIGGLFAPNQGWFPQYDSGLYTQGETNMLVSRGIGDSAFPIRFNNRPQIIVVELQKEESKKSPGFPGDFLTGN